VADVRVHRRAALRDGDLTQHEGIPVTTPTMTLIDLAAGLGERELERAVNEADRLDLVDPVTLLDSLDGYPAREGVGRLRKMLTGQVFLLTDSELERRFLRLIRRAHLPLPQTGARLNGYRVDFHWPDLGLVVETDGLRYHRTPAQQARDNRRDQAHTAAGLTPLRFSHADVRFEPRHVEMVLWQTIERLRVEAAPARRRGSAWPPRERNGRPASVSGS
jgi:very-short-patch-repair endonuclease